MHFLVKLKDVRSMNDFVVLSYFLVLILFSQATSKDGDDSLFKCYRSFLCLRRNDP